ncbi:MAG: hypothetical protein HZA88_24225 [Verrucomicrobia bacterium]|nr:hypothetical protein [Verrucomicrobiota bacterium]
MYQHQISDHLTPAKPFGPEDAATIVDPFCKRMLFQTQNRIFKNMSQHPTLIVGRKGSGKTAFLQNAMQDESAYKYVYEINTTGPLASVIRTILRIAPQETYVETIAELWSIAFWLTGAWRLDRVAKHDLSSEAHHATKSYLDLVTPPYCASPADLIEYYFSLFSTAGEPRSIEGLPDRIWATDVGGYTLKEVRRHIIDSLASRGLRALLLVDSLDDFQMGREYAEAAIKGLLKSLGKFAAGNPVYEVRFCLPAEIFPLFREMSSNPAKDFANKVSLYWHASELLCLAAQRLSLFYKTHCDYDGFCRHNIEHLDINNRKDAAILFNEIFGTTIENCLGQTEDTISYIMRHTQLLPRHLLLILNSICHVNIEMGGSHRKIEPDAIRRGIMKVEETICYEIFAAYRSIYPRGQQVCESCIPELPLSFDFGHLQKVFNYRGKKALESEEFEHFTRMLFRMGVIGKVNPDAETERYIQGEFEYSADHSLSFSSSDTLCLHPVFSYTFSAHVGKDYPSKPVLPVGSDFNSADARSF